MSTRRRASWVGGAQRFTAAFLVAALPIAGGLLAQEPAADHPGGGAGLPVFGEAIDVRVVNIDVWVTDKKGTPITGLTADDFELREEKRPVEITNFYELEGVGEVGTEPREPTRRRPGEPPPPSDSRLRELPSHVPAEQRLSLMVYVDETSLTPTGRNRVLPYLREFLRRKLGPLDRAMLVVYRQPPIQVVRPLTAETWTIAEATYELEQSTGGRLRTESARLDILRELDRDDVSYSRAIELVRTYAQTVSSEVELAVTGLREAIAMLAGLPGPKALLYVSEGLPMRSAEDLFRAVEERFANDLGRFGANSRPGLSSVPPDAENASLEAYAYDSTQRFREISALANANRATLYTLDAAGNRVRGMGAADLRFSSRIDSAYSSNLQSSIVYLAEATGGQAIVYTNNFGDGLDRIASDFGHRYSLGFSPGHGGNGGRYDVAVDLTREARQRHDRNLVLRYRRSYLDKPVSAEMGDATLSALTLGYDSNPLGIRIEKVRGPGSEERLESGKVRAQLLALLPLDHLTLLPVGSDYVGRARLWVQALDEKGRTSAVSEQPAEIQIEGEKLPEALRKSWPYLVDVVVEPGGHKIAVAVRDELTARFSVVTLDVDVGSEPPAGAAPPRSDAAVSPERELERAVELYAQGHLDEMAIAARRALAATDDIRLRTRAYNLLGVALFDRPNRTPQDVDEAEEAFRQVIAVMGDEASLVPRYSLAKLLLDTARVDESVAEARKIIEISAVGEVPDQARILVCHARPRSEPAGALLPPADAADAGGGARAPAEMIFKPANAYPPGARAARTEGVVRLRAQIDTEGCVTDVEVLEGLPDGLTESAVAGLRQSVFRPAMIDGKPIAATFDTEASFELPEGP